jgi:hypothetical protein
VHARAARVDAQEAALHGGDAAALTQKRLGRVVVGRDVVGQDIRERRDVVQKRVERAVGQRAKAAFVGAKTVKLPGPASVSTRPAA